MTEKTTIGEVQVGERVMTLSDWPGVPAGTKGSVVEIYNIGRSHHGISIEWDGKDIADGFSEDELEYLRFETEKHPKFYKSKCCGAIMYESGACTYCGGDGRHEIK